MNEFMPNQADGLHTRREFGRILAAATSLSVSFPLLHGASPMALVPECDRVSYVPEDTYPYFTDSAPAHHTDQRHAEPGAAPDPARKAGPGR